MAMATACTREEEQKPKVLLLKPIPPPFEAALSPKFDLVKAHESPLPLTTFLSPHSHHIKAIVTVGLITIVDSSLVDQLLSLGLVAASTAGVNHIDLNAFRKRGVAVTNAGEKFSPDVADLAVGLLVDVLRRVTMADRYVRNGLWMLKGGYPLGSKVRCS